MSNYGHIVYAGGAHGITLKGTPSVSQGGYQIVDVSSNMTDGSIAYDADFVENIIKFPCAAEPTVKSDVESYLYCVPGNGASMFVRLARRGMERVADIEDDASGGFKRRPDVNEALVDIRGIYPYQLIGSPVFTALDTDPRTFYRDQSPVPQANIEASQVPDGSLTRDAALRFAQEHEQEVKKLAYYLLDQLSRTPSERCAVAIRDTEPNIRLWVAAATCELPLNAALQVSFNTRVSVLTPPRNQLIYDVQKNGGGYVKNFNIQNPNLERRLYALVIGVDPNAFDEAKLRQKTPDKPFIPMSEIEAPNLASQYFADMVTNDDKIRSFNECLRDLKGCPCDLSLTKVYDAYCVLSMRDYESYEEIGRALDVMGPLFTERSFLQCYVIDQVARALLEDHCDAALSDVVCKLIPILPRVSAADVRVRFENALKDGISTSLAVCRNLKSVAKIIKALNAVPEEAKAILMSTVGNTLQGDASMAECIAMADEADVQQLLYIIDSYKRASGEKWTDLLQAERSPAITAAVNRAAASEKLTDVFLSILGSESQAVDVFMIRGVKAIGTDKNRRIKWWLGMAMRNVPLDKLCALISRYGEKGDIEAILCAQIRQNGQKREFQELYAQYLANDPNAGGDYYSEWMRSLADDPDRMKGIRSILNSLGSTSAQADIFRKVLAALDAEIVYQNTRENEQLAELVSQFAARARLRCPNAEVLAYLKAMTGVSGSIFRSKRENPADAYLKCNAFAQCFDVKAGFAASKMCKEFIAAMLDTPEEPSAYVILASSFAFASAADEKAYYDHIADCMCTLLLKKRSLSLSTLIYTIDCIGEGNALRKDIASSIIEKLDESKLLQGLNRILHACEERLCEERTDGVAEKVIAETVKQFGSRTAKHLSQILDSAREQYQKNHKGGLFGRLFGKK